MRTLRACAIAAVVIAAVAAIAALAVSDGAQATGYRQTYLQLNLCGSACNRGGLAVVLPLEQAIEDRAPFAVTLNEVCENQYARLLADLTSYQGRFDPTGPRCRNGARYGNAALVRAASVHLVGSWLLPDPAGDETRRLMCLGTDPPEGGSMIVCVTHVSNVLGNIAAEVSAVADILRGLDRGTPLLLGGDFNTDPGDPRLDALFSPCYPAGTGTFDEADSAGCAPRTTLGTAAGSDIVNEQTYKRHKFDDIFLRSGAWSSPSAEVADVVNGLSDHRALWATATLRHAPPKASGVSFLTVWNLCGFRGGLLRLDAIKSPRESNLLPVLGRPVGRSSPACAHRRRHRVGPYRSSRAGLRRRNYRRIRGRARAGFPDVPADTALAESSGAQLRLAQSGLPDVPAVATADASALLDTFARQPRPIDNRSPDAGRVVADAGRLLAHAGRLVARAVADARPDADGVRVPDGARPGRGRGSWATAGGGLHRRGPRSGLHGSAPPAGHR